MRKLVTIRRISEIRPIPNADAIETAIVDGWTVVIKRGEFHVGELAIFCEIDSWVPHEIAPYLSKGKPPREFNGIKGERLRTVKLRGQLSQGLLLPLGTPNATVFPAVWYYLQSHCGDDVDPYTADFSTILGILKWEPPIPAQLSGRIQGVFPTMVPKTDQERAQNLVSEIRNWANQQLVFEVTEKLEGSSCTMFLDSNGKFHVCSRNWDLSESPEVSFWQVARKLNVEQKMRELGLSGFALQGELIGPGIQGNIYKLNDHNFVIFDVYDSMNQCYLPALERVALCNQLNLRHAPVIESEYRINGTIDDLLVLAEGKSQLWDTEREGLVFKCVSNPSVSFKVISNAYLLRW